MRVLVLLYPGVNLLDVAGPAQAFEAAGRLSGTQVTLEFCMPGGGTVPSDTGLPLVAEASETKHGATDIFIVPGSNIPQQVITDPHLIAEVQRLASESEVIASICTGSTILAQAGLLAGKRASTHWRYADLFAALFPETVLDPDQIYTQDGRVWTSAGVSAGIDLALALVSQQFGRTVAVDVARDLVVPLMRAGGQKQFSTQLELQSSADVFGDLHEWISSNLQADLRVDQLADRCGMSARNFARKHVEMTGLTPAKMVERLRVERCLQLLETSDAAIKEIAGVCGFSSVNAVRRAVRRAKGIDPTRYRTQFGLRHAGLT